MKSSYPQLLENLQFETYKKHFGMIENALKAVSVEPDDFKLGLETSNFTAGIRFFKDYVKVLGNESEADETSKVIANNLGLHGVDTQAKLQCWVDDHLSDAALKAESLAAGIEEINQYLDDLNEKLLEAQNESSELLQEIARSPANKIVALIADLHSEQERLREQEEKDPQELFESQYRLLTLEEIKSLDFSAPVTLLEFIRAPQMFHHPIVEKNKEFIDLIERVIKQDDETSRIEKLMSNGEKGLTELNQLVSSIAVYPHISHRTLIVETILNNTILSNRLKNILEDRVSFFNFDKLEKALDQAAYCHDQLITELDNRVDEIKMAEEKLERILEDNRRYEKNLNDHSRDGSIYDKYVEIFEAHNCIITQFNRERWLSLKIKRIEDDLSHVEDIVKKYSDYCEKLNSSSDRIDITDFQNSLVDFFIEEIKFSDNDSRKIVDQYEKTKEKREDYNSAFKELVNLKKNIESHNTMHDWLQQLKETNKKLQQLSEKTCSPDSLVIFYQELNQVENPVKSAYATTSLLARELGHQERAFRELTKLSVNTLNFFYKKLSEDIQFILNEHRPIDQSHVDLLSYSDEINELEEHLALFSNFESEKDGLVVPRCLIPTGSLAFDINLKRSKDNLQSKINDLSEKIVEYNRDYFFLLKSQVEENRLKLNKQIEKIKEIMEINSWNLNQVAQTVLERTVEAYQSSLGKYEQLMTKIDSLAIVRHEQRSEVFEEFNGINNMIVDDSRKNLVELQANTVFTRIAYDKVRSFLMSFYLRIASTFTGVPYKSLREAHLPRGVKAQIILTTSPGLFAPKPPAGHLAPEGGVENLPTPYAVR